MKATRRSFLAALASIPFMGKFVRFPVLIDIDPEKAMRDLHVGTWDELVRNPDVIWVNASQARALKEFYGGNRVITGIRDEDLV